MRIVVRTPPRRHQGNDYAIGSALKRFIAKERESAYATNTGGSRLQSPISRDPLREVRQIQEGARISWDSLRETFRPIRPMRHTPPGVCMAESTGNTDRSS